MTADRRFYSQEAKAEAVGLGLTIGARAAGRRLGIPYRNVARWMAAPESVPAVVRTREDVAARLWEGITVGSDEVMAGLRDGKARLSEKAQALKVLMESHQLLTGGATSHLEVHTSHNESPLTDDERRELADWLDQVDWYEKRRTEETPDA